MEDRSLSETQDSRHYSATLLLPSNPPPRAGQMDIAVKLDRRQNRAKARDLEFEDKTGYLPFWTKSDIECWRL